MLTSSQIHRDFIHGMAKIFILHQAGQGPVYGNKLSKALKALGYQISPGSLYPLLHTLEKSGLLHSRIRVFKGRLRKYYELTEQGRLCLAALRRELRDLVKTVFLSQDPLSESSSRTIEDKPGTRAPADGR